MGDFGIKVSKEGFDVGTASDLNLAFTSKYPMFKEFMSGAGTVTLPVGTPAAGTVSVSHNLGYRPAFILIADQDNITLTGGTAMAGFERMPNRNSGGFAHVFGVSGTSTFWVKVRDDANNTSRNFQFRYYIMVDKAE